MADACKAVAVKAVTTKDPKTIKTVKTVKEVTDALKDIQALCDDAPFVKHEPHLLQTFPEILQYLQHKNSEASTVARSVVKSICNNSSIYVVEKLVLPPLLKCLKPSFSAQMRMYTLDLLCSYAETHSTAISNTLHDIIPVLCDVVNDARKELAKRAEEVLYACTLTSTNKDIAPFLKTLVDCLAHPEQIPECVHTLSSTTFVQAVETPTIAIILPILRRGLTERTIATVRRTTVICENMCKLVENPLHAVPLINTLIPLLDRVKTTSSDPECRTVASRAYDTLFKASQIIATLPTPKNIDGLISVNIDAGVLRTHVACVLQGLVDNGCSDLSVWHTVVTPYLRYTYADSATVYIESVHRSLFGDAVGAVKAEEESGEDLCNCEFSLAYGGKILLSQTRLHLRRGQRYGLCGANGTGKSTLLRAIANGQLEGFPSKDEVRTAVVEHDLDGSLSDMSCLDYLMNTRDLTTAAVIPVIIPAAAIPTTDATAIPTTDAAAIPTTDAVVIPAAAIIPAIPAIIPAAAIVIPQIADVIAVMEDIGFNAKRRAMSIFSLSGGWKMKLALARAILMKADILLLDEPTNHLDVTNVAWLADYLNSQHNVTSLIVSHDTAFLDNVCSAIIHYEGFKLKKYMGNLTEFVKLHPEAKSYYSLTDSVSEFSFPAPGLLDGINSKGTPFIKMADVAFTYAGADAPSIADASVMCSLSSRVGCIGPNGAGKSTLVKVLMGELVPQKGAVWKHPNLRSAYVAQHAFHHLEEHLDKTPSEYIQWRFRTGDDFESMNKEALAITEAEERAIAAKITIDGEKFVVDKIMGRIKEKGIMMYEVKWMGCEIDKNKWLPRTWFTDRGISKMVDVFDAQKAAEEGLLSRPLTGSNIVKHLRDVGLDDEFTLHSRIRGLSGGQKVKVVIGAAMWMNPHLVVLDEPTNYLDRDSLGALSKAIAKFEGGVVIISHNSEFTKSVCTEHWFVNDGVLRVEGGAMRSTIKIEKPLVADEVRDAAGNVIKIKVKRTYTAREIKDKMRRHKEKVKAAKAGESVSDDDEALIELDLI